MLALKKIEGYDRDAIRVALTEALAERGGFEALLAGRDSVLLKPNFVVPEVPDKWATTHPDVYMTVATMLLDAGKTVAIGDSPAFGSARQAVKLHGVRDECRDLGIEVITFRQPTSYAGVADQPRYKELSIATELDRFDALINLPKLKVHQQFVMTGATKNLYGCVTGKRKFYRHNVCANDPIRFAKMITANARRAAPVLNIGDGITAMHVKGPRGGQPFELQRLIVSDDCLVHDWLFCLLTGTDPMSTPLFQSVDAATRAGLEAACAPIVASAEFAVAEGFRPSYLVDISFRPQHLIRTVWRSVMFQLKQLRSGA